MNTALYLALGWLAGLVLAVNAGIPVPDGFGLVILGLMLTTAIATTMTTATMTHDPRRHKHHPRRRGH